MTARQAIADAYGPRTGRGINIAAVAGGPLDQEALAAALSGTLRTAGLADPQAGAREVPGIARHPETGKGRRLIPL